MSGGGPLTWDSDPVKVLHVITGLAAGGAETQLRLLVRNSRHEADVVALYNAGSVADDLRSDGVRVVDLQMRGNKDLRAVGRLRSTIRQGGYDVVHTHLYRACLYGRLAARLAGVRRVVATEHSLVDDQLEGRQATRGVRLLYLAGERLGRQTIAVSGAVRDNLLRWGIAADRVVTVPNGLDIAALEFDAGARGSVRRTLAIPEGSPVIGAVGRLHPGKRFDLLLSSLQDLLRGGAHLVVVGDGPERARLEDLAARLEIAQRVHLVGEQPVAPYLSAMDVLVSPSRYETFGLAVLEGLAAGLPVVYRRCPALDELPSPPSAAVPIADDGDLAPAVSDALSRPPSARSCPDELRGLGITAVAARIDDVYERLR